MRHNPLVCIEDAIKACELILQFIQGMTREDFYTDAKTKAAVERKIEIIGEALNRIKIIDSGLLARIENWREILLTPINGISTMLLTANPSSWVCINQY